MSHSMGGNAFKSSLPTASFPRMPPSVYTSLKDILLNHMQALYESVAVPPEAPGKSDYGDLDIVVARPRAGLAHHDVQVALHAICSIPPEGGRVTNFAVPATALRGECTGFEILDRDGTTPSTADVYYQVDVTVLDDQESWERTVFMTSYGDLGLILGHIAHSVGLSLGPNGLKLADTLPLNPPIHFQLSTSLPHVLTFLGLAHARWAAGFAAQDEIFAWVATSPLFDARAISAHATSREPRDNSKERGRKARAMFQAFLAYATEITAALPEPELQESGTDAEAKRAQRRAEVQRGALEYFGRDATHAALLRANDVRRHAESIFNGTLVQEWTTLRGVPVKWLMDAVRAQLGARYVAVHPGEGWCDAVGPVRLDGRAEADEEGRLASVAPWEMALSEMREEGVREEVLKVREEMDKAGKLVFDWRAAKARKLASKKSKSTSTPAQEVQAT